MLKTVERAMLPGMARVAGGSVYSGLALQGMAREMAGQAGLADFLYRALSQGSLPGRQLPAEAPGDPTPACKGGRAGGAGPVPGRKPASPEYNMGGQNT
ncbi:MAG: hypothetical protein QME70_06675 [Bacillota bacterium]|nr:hypothetical protein [Bacillota bacterium]